MTEPSCAVCQRKLKPNEIKLNERRTKSRYSRKRYLCVRCRRDEYDQYQKSFHDLINKKNF